MKLKRILALSLALILMLALVGCNGGEKADNSDTGSESQVVEDKFPTEPIRYVLANAPGGSIETLIRKFQPYLEEALGQPIMIECIEGAGGIIGTNVVKEAEPDGYTIMTRSASSLINSFLRSGADFTLDDFDYLSRFSNDPAVIMVRNDSPYQTINDLIEDAKANPGKVRVSVSGINDINYLALRVLEEQAGIDLNLVTYDGGSKSRLAVINGEVAATQCNYFGASSMWDDCRILAVCHTENNLEALEGIPTLNDALGLDVPPAPASYMVFMPDGVKEQYPERFEKLLNAFETAWSNPEFLEAMKEMGQDGYIEVLSPEETVAEIDMMYEFLASTLDMAEG